MLASKLKNLVKYVRRFPTESEHLDNVHFVFLVWFLLVNGFGCAWRRLVGIALHIRWRLKLVFDDLEICITIRQGAKCE